MYKGIIYCAISPSNKKYYGKTVGTLKGRKKGHLKNSTFAICRFSSAIRKYSIDNFNWIEIETIEAESKILLRKYLNEREKYWINKEKTYLPEFGYNMTFGGDGGGEFGRKLSEETKQKIKNSLLGKKYSEERKKNMSMNSIGISRGKNKKKSEEHKLHISEAGKLKPPVSNETRKKMSESKKGKSATWKKDLPAWNRGISPSKETIEKRIETRKKNKQLKSMEGI